MGFERQPVCTLRPQSSTEVNALSNGGFDGGAVVSARAPRVRPAPSGPRESCTNERFKGRYGKSEVFSDHGKRHFEEAWTSLFDETPSDNRHHVRTATPSKCSSRRSPSPGGNHTSELVGSRSASIVARTSSPLHSKKTSRVGSKETLGISCAPDLFSAAPGAWTPMRRSSSRAGSPSGCSSPLRSGCASNSGVARAGSGAALVIEASRRLQAELDSPRDFLPVPQTASPGSCAGTPCLRHQAVNPQMISPTMAGLLQQSPASDRACSPGQGVTLTRDGWSCKKLGKDHRNTSKGVGGLINGGPAPAKTADAMGGIRAGRDMHSSKGVGSVFKGASAPTDMADAIGGVCSRQDTSPRRGGLSNCDAVRGGFQTPWGLDEAMREDEQKLAYVARSCMQRTELHYEAEQRLQLRPERRSALSPRRPGSVSPSARVAATDGLHRRVRRPMHSTTGGQTYNECSSAAPKKFALSDSQAGESRTALQECSRKVQAVSNLRLAGA